jgi:hypothetical protein
MQLHCIDIFVHLQIFVHQQIQDPGHRGGAMLPEKTTGMFTF